MAQPSICLTLLVSVTMHAHAGEMKAENRQPPPIAEIEIRGSKSDIEETRDFVAGKIIIGQKDIQDSGAQSVSQVLRREPAVTVGKDGMVGLMGLPGYTQILIDGKPADGGDPLELNVIQVERIEIIKSATAVTGPFGVAGTINIVRRNIARKAETQIQLGAQSAHGALGESATWMSNQVSRDTPLSYNLSMSADRVDKNSFSSYRQTGASAMNTVAGDSTQQQRSDSLSGRGVFTLKLDADHKLTLEPGAFYYRSESRGTELSSASDRGDFALFRATRSALKSLSLPLRWDGQLDQDSVLKIKLNSIFLDADLDIGLSEKTPVFGQHLRSQRRRSLHRTHTLDIDYTTSIARGHDLSAGAGAVRNRHHNVYHDVLDDEADLSRAALGTSNLVRVTRYQLYVQDDWRINRSLAAGMGLNGERRVYDIDERLVRNRTSFTMWSPTVHLAKKIDAGGKHQLRLSLSRTFQPPSMDQMLRRPSISQLAPCYPQRPCIPNQFDTADSTGNPFLQPERSLGANLTYTHKFAKASEFGVELYSHDIANKTGWQSGFETVSWSDLPRYIVRPVNLGSATVRGFDLSGRLNLQDRWQAAAALTLTGSVGFAHSEVRSIAGRDNRIAGQLPWRAKVAALYSAASLPLKLAIDASWLPSDWVRSNERLRNYQAGKLALNANASWKFLAGPSLVLGVEDCCARARRAIDEYQADDALSRRYSSTRVDPRLTVKFDLTL